MKPTQFRRAPLADSNDIFSASVAPAATPQWSTRQNPAEAHENEDRSFLQFGAMWTELGEELTFTIAGVADGHGGEAASDFVARNAAGLLADNMANYIGDVHSAVAETFGSLESDCLAIPDQSGACVCLCLVGAGKVWCANLGDCRAIMFGWEGDICWLSVDHRSGEGAEYERIVDAGGAVVGNAVEGLMPSRTLGDADVKGKCPRGVISAEPEVRVLEEEGLIVIATDGLWDVLSTDDIASLLPPPGKARRRLGQDSDLLQVLAAHLVEAAIKAGSADDVTAIVVPVI